MLSKNVNCPIKMGGSLKYEELEEIYKEYPEYKDIDVFVESGTYKGETTREMAKFFSQVHTVEICEELHNEAKENGKRHNILYYLGDSCVFLPKIVNMVNKPSIYFLDAHISGADSSWNGKELVPLLKELDLILEKQKHKSIYIIDDARFFTNDNKPHDWAEISIEKILSLFPKHGVKVRDAYLKNDRYVVLTK